MSNYYHRQYKIWTPARANLICRVNWEFVRKFQIQNSTIKQFPLIDIKRQKRIIVEFGSSHMIRVHIFAFLDFSQELKIQKFESRKKLTLFIIFILLSFHLCSERLKCSSFTVSPFQIWPEVVLGLAKSNRFLVMPSIKSTEMTHAL